MCRHMVQQMASYQTVLTDPETVGDLLMDVYAQGVDHDVH